MSSFMILDTKISSRLVAALVGFTALAGVSMHAFAQSGFDVLAVPRPEGAEIADGRSSSSSVTYVFPTSRADAARATEQALNTGGWQRYRTPDQPQSDRYKNGRNGLYVSYSMAGGKADQSRISYSYNNAITANVPFPQDATDIIYDETRPYLRLVTGMSVDAAMEFFREGLGAEGWAPLDAAAIAAGWPNAKPGAAVENGMRVYFNRTGRAQQYPPVMLTLQRDAAGKTVVDLRTAPFALPQELAFYQDFAGLPASQRYKRSGGTGNADSPKREATALVIAELPVVLAFYRREMTSRGYQEQAGASISDNAAKVTFAKPDETAVLELKQVYDLIDVRLVAQISQAAIAERARAKREADAKWMRDARQQTEGLIAATNAGQIAAAAAAANAPVETLQPLANSGTAIPVPGNATALKFDGDDGKLEFTSPSTPQSVAQFYRGQMKTLGWREIRSPINNPNMVRLDFTKGAQRVGLTVMMFGGNARVTADGNGLQTPPDPNRAKEQLEGEDASGFPVPKKRTMSAPGAWNTKGGGVPFRRDFNAQVPSDIGSVLAFYRRELGKKDWKELTEGASIRPEAVTLAFSAPEGPAVLKLGRRGRDTTVSIVVRNPAEAAKAGVLPPAGMAKIVMGNIGDNEATLTINQKTFKVAPGTGSSKTPDGPSIELKPGKYRYTMKSGGKASRPAEIRVSAGDTWGLMIGPGGVLDLQIY
jgi:hypothetical protein